MAEGVGFEPTRPFGLTVFKTAAIDHSATLPVPDPKGPAVDPFPGSSQPNRRHGASGKILSLSTPAQDRSEQTNLRRHLVNRVPEPLWRTAAAVVQHFRVIHVAPQA